MKLKEKDDFARMELADSLWLLSEASYAEGSPWTVAQFEEDLKNPNSRYLLLVEEEIIGYLGYHQVVDEVEIFNIALQVSFKGQGLANRLLNAFFKKIKEEQIVQIFLEVRVSNTRAQQLYRTNGFEVIARRKGYYQHPLEDALIMCKKVSSENE